MPKHPQGQKLPQYVQAQLRARAKAGALGTRALASIGKTLDQYADELTALIASLPADKAKALLATREIVLKTSASLELKLAQLVKEHRTASFEEVLALWSDASLDAAHAVGIPKALLGGVLAPNVTLLGAYESLGGASSTWRTLIAQNVGSGAREADALIRAALASDMAPDELAKRLRPYVTGAKSSIKDAFPNAGAEQLKAMEDAARATKEGARRVRQNATRIAFSEVHNARAEAEVQHFAADPLVDAVIWTLSPFRGKIKGPDTCDIYAGADMYGLGPGVFPLDAVPLPPHPFDRCERTPRQRPWAEAGEPKPRKLKRLLDPKHVDLKTICAVK